MQKHSNNRTQSFLPLIFCIIALILSLNLNGQNKESPNIILINVDDMGWRDLGFMGSKYYNTPVLDQFARQSKVLFKGYAAASNCAPSRATIMTGLWSPRHGVYTVSPSTRGKSEDRKIIPTKNSSFIPEESVIFPQLLRDHGYTTCHSGKWHISESPLDYGFQVNIGGSKAGHPKSYYPPYQNVDLDGEPDQYLTDLIMEKTMEFIDTTKGKFFINYAPYAVHTPIQEVDSLMHKYSEKPNWHGQENPAYATMVENLDRNIGLLLKAIEEKGILNRTLIIFTCDNGGLDGITDQFPLRAGKGSYYEGGIRVPIFFYWKDKIEAGIDYSLVASHIDLYPTILDAAGVETKELSYDGENLLPYLTGEKTQDARSLYFHFPVYLQAYRKKDETRDPLFRTRPGSAVIDGPWKLIYYFEDKDSELFNLELDITESSDLSDLYQDEKQRLMMKLEEWWKTTDAPIPSEPNPEYQGE